MTPLSAFITVDTNVAPGIRATGVALLKLLSMLCVMEQFKPLLPLFWMVKLSFSLTVALVCDADVSVIVIQIFAGAVVAVAGMEYNSAQTVPTHIIICFDIVRTSIFRAGG